MQLIKNIEDDNLRIVAVDFDGTLCRKEKFPAIGEPNTELISWLIHKQLAGVKVILWTCREGENLNAAVEWSRKHGIVFDAVNSNVCTFDTESRKIYADLYIDDRACLPKWR